MAHLTHGSKFTHSGRFYENHNYELVDEMLDYDELRKRLYEVKPRLLITGYSAYSHKIDFQKIREIVDEYNTNLEIDTIFPEDANLSDEEINKLYDQNKCILWTDMAHFSGFIAAHVWEDKYDPTKWADVITTTTHKTLRGPRSAIILWNNPDYCKKINQAVFPANGGGCNQAATAAKAQAFIEAATPEFKHYIEQVHTNMQALIEGIKEVDTEKKLRFVSGDITENHMILVDVKGAGLLGKEAVVDDYVNNIGAYPNLKNLFQEYNIDFSSFETSMNEALGRRYKKEEISEIMEDERNILIMLRDSLFLPYTETHPEKQEEIENKFNTLFSNYNISFDSKERSL